MSSKDDLIEITCPACDMSFYVEVDESPYFCPHCCETTGSNPEIITTYKCSLTGISFTHKEAHELNGCIALGGREQQCATCNKVIKK